jgi:hypothetical protein
VPAESASIEIDSGGEGEACVKITLTGSSLTCEQVKHLQCHEDYLTCSLAAD